MNPTRVIMELSREARFWVCQGGAWERWPTLSVARHLCHLHWERGFPLPPPDPAERRLFFPGCGWLRVFRDTDGALRVAP